jgi:hypothetical protein
LYRDVLQILAQLDEPDPGTLEEAGGSATVNELPEVLATLATLTPPRCQQRQELLDCLKALLEQYGALEVRQAA